MLTRNPQFEPSLHRAGCPRSSAESITPIVPGTSGIPTSDPAGVQFEPSGHPRTHVHTHTEAETLAEQITELAAHITAATYQLLVLIERFDREEGWAGPGLRSCAHWLSWQCGMSLGAARERVRVARALPALPRISAAFRTGRVSYAKVRAMTRVATPDNEDVLLNVALHGTASHVERQVRAYRRVRRIEALEAEQARHFQRRFSLYEDDDGSWVVRARLTPEQGALLARALEVAGEQLWREERDVPEDVSAETPSPSLDQPIPAAHAVRRADALARVVEGFLSPAVDGEGRGASTGTHGLSGGDRCCVHLHATAETLTAAGEDAEAALEVTPGRPDAPVSAETARRLSCDAALVHWAEDANGSTLDIGRKSRTVPPALRRALRRRDGGCRFPGCSCTRFVDAHHVVHWADGGRTALDNLVLLCRVHHRKVHEEGFGVTMKDGQPVFTLPSGALIPPAPTPRFRGNVIELRRRNLRAGLRIGPETLPPNWRGEVMDLDHAVLGLLQRE